MPLGTCPKWRKQITFTKSIFEEISKGTGIINIGILANQTCLLNRKAN